MANQGSTRISDIVVPEVYIPYIREESVNKNALIQSGVVVSDPAMDELAVRGGKLINIPFFQDLSGDDEVLTSGTGATDSALTPDNMTTGRDIAVLWTRGKAWGVEDLAAALAGDDPMAAIADKIINYWNTREQALLIKILDGVFRDNEFNDSSDLISDISIADGNNAVDANLISATAVIDAATKLGDMADKLTAIAVHSIPYSRLVKQDLIDFVPDSQGKLTIPTYLGKRLFVDDTCPKIAGATSGYKYTSYLFGEGAIAKGEGSPPVAMETDRDSLKGLDYLIHRRHFILHPRGIRFLSTSVSADTPSNTEAAYASNWNRVYEKKNIRLVKLVTNG